MFLLRALPIPIITYTKANKLGICIYVADNLNLKLRNDFKYL